MKFYAVKKGRQPGVYRTWEAAKKQVDGYPNAEYKSFTKVTDATEYLAWDQPTIDQVFQKDEDSLKQAIAKIQQASHDVKQKQPVAEHKPKQFKGSVNTQQDAAAFFATIYTDGGTRNTGNFKGGHVKKTDKAAWA